MKISFITTVLNEEETIIPLLESLESQTKPPDEVIIVDGGSTDNTLSAISNKKIKVRLLIKKGNRSVGRNEAIRNSKGEVIVCTDGGCVLQRDWIEQITKPFKDSEVDVVAGFYKGMVKNAFEKALVPFVLVMEDRLNPNNFLPATRSIAFKKNIWKKLEGFDEKLNNNEDYVFAKKLKKAGTKILFAKEAIVFWRPRKNLKEAFIMFYRFAKGDSESGIFRPKVILILGRYLIGIIFLLLFFYTHLPFLAILIAVLAISYVFWAVLKNYKYVDNLLSTFYLIVLQFLSDFAVITGTVSGLINRLGKRN